MQKAILVLSILFISFESFAQKAIVKGILFDEQKNIPLELGTITLKNNLDSSKLIGAKSKENGQFQINNVAYGTYTATFSLLGFASETQKNIVINKSEFNFGSIKLSSSKTNLKELNIVGEKNTIELAIDKKVFNADKNITSAGGTASDLLKNVPSVNVDMDGNVSIRGKDNVTILVDGKPSSMFGNDPQTVLQNLPASSIESIEVITNPSAKYDAQGMNGILNIILKKDKKAGYNAIINAGVGFPYRLNAGVNLNANKNRWNVFLNANFRTSKSWEETTNNRDNYEDTYTFSSFTRNNRRPLSGFINLGAEYTINKKNKITLSQNFFNANMKGASVTTIQNELSYDTLLNQQVRFNNYTGKPLSATTNLQYKHTFDKPKEELNVELNFSKTRYKRESEFETTLYNNLLQVVNGFRQENPVLGGNWNATFQLDYTKPIGKNARLDIGERSYYIRFESENQPTIQYLNQSEIPETILKNHFQYTQQVHAVYSNYATQFGTTGIQVGLRAEYFIYDGFAYQYNAGSKDDYISFFPTLFVNQKLSKKEELQFNYARRVNRPGFRQLIPYLDVTNPQDTTQGNPDLRPEFIHSFEVSYNYQYGKNNTFIASSYYQFTNNLIQRYRRFNGDGTTYSQDRNLATGITYGVELTNKINILSWWDATMNVNLFRNILQVDNVAQDINRNGFGGFAKLISNTKLRYGYNFQVTGNYNARTVVAQGDIAHYGNVDIALKKGFWKNALNVTFTIADLLNTIQTETNYNYFPVYNQTVLRKNLTRMYGINVQLRLASKTNTPNNDTPRKNSGQNKKELKSRDENLKKDDGGSDEGGGGREGNR